MSQVFVAKRVSRCDRCPHPILPGDKICIPPDYPRALHVPCVWFDNSDLKEKKETT